MPTLRIPYGAARMSGENPAVGCMEAKGRRLSRTELTIRAAKGPIDLITRRSL